MFVALALFGIAFSNCMFDAVKCAIGNIYGGFTLLSDLLVNDVSVLLK